MMAARAPIPIPQVGLPDFRAPEPDLDDDDDPVIFMESEQMYGDKGEVPEEEYVLPIGVADIKRKGEDVTIVSYNKMMKVALSAAEALEKEDISAEVIDLRTIRPLDKATVLASLAKTNRLVVAEEGWPTCSVGSEILAICMEEGFDDLDAPVLRITNEDVPMPYAANLEKAMLVNADKIVAGVRRTLGA
jgi:pyruvate dehydrogenase E1 component beta subunit